MILKHYQILIRNRSSDDCWKGSGCFSLILPASGRLSYSGSHERSWQYLKLQDPVELFHLTAWSSENRLCKTKSWSWEIRLVKFSSSYFGDVSLRLVCCCPPPRPRTPAPGTEAACLLRLLIGQTSWLPRKELPLPGHYISSLPQRKEDFLQPIFSKGLGAMKFCH